MGNGVAQGLAFVAYVVLLRLFSPEDFGLCNIFFSYAEVLIILSTCKYEMAVVVADNNTDAQRLARLALRINTGVSLLLAAVAAVLMAVDVQVAGMPPILLLLIPLLVYFTGTNRVYTFLCNRSSAYRHMAVGEVVNVASSTLARLAMGLLAPLLQLLHTVGLPLGSVLGKVAGHFYYRNVALKTLKDTNTPEVLSPSTSHLSPLTFHLSSFKELASRYRNFPLYVMPRELVSSFSANLPFMWLGIYFESPLIGLFALAYTFTSRPVNVLAGAFEKSFYTSTASKVSQGLSIGRDVARFVLLLGGATVLLGTVAFFWAEPIFTFLFGSQWVGTGYYVRCLMPWMAVLVLSNSMVFVGNVFGTQRVDFVLQLVQLALRAAALGVGIQRGDFRLAILLFAAVSAVVQLVQLGWYLYQVRRYQWKLKRQNGER